MRYCYFLLFVGLVTVCLPAPSHAQDVSGEALLRHVHAGETTAVQQQLKAGADPNVTDSAGRTALMIALQEEHEAVARLLLEHEAGADLTVSDDQGMTVLMYALRHGNEAVVEATLEAGADLTARTEEGLTVLGLAAGIGHLGVTRAALNAGADPNATAEIQMGPGTVEATPLTMAAMRGHTASVQLLLEAGGDPSISDAETGIGPLAVAAMAGQAPVVAVLLAVDADPETTVLGMPLAEAAAEEGHALVVALLRGRGDEPTVRRAVAMAEEARTLAHRLKAWIRDHRDDPRLQSLDPSTMNALFEMAGLTSKAAPYVGEHGTYALSVIDGDFTVVGTRPDTDASVEAVIEGFDRRGGVTLRTRFDGPRKDLDEQASAYVERRREAAVDALRSDALRIASEIQDWARKPTQFGGGNDGIDETPEDDLAGVTFDDLGYPTDGSIYSNAMGSFELGSNSSGLACDDPSVPDGVSSATELVTLYAYNTDRDICVRIDLYGSEDDDIAVAVTPSR